jgi:hypothetical protein
VHNVGGGSAVCKTRLGASAFDDLYVDRRARRRGARRARQARQHRRENHWIDNRTGWSIKKFVRTSRRYRTIQIKASGRIATAADPLPDDLSEALTKIGNRVEH